MVVHMRPRPRSRLRLPSAPAAAASVYHHNRGPVPSRVYETGAGLYGWCGRLAGVVQGSRAAGVAVGEGSPGNLCMFFCLVPLVCI
ncbi:hypothetical protein GGTG_13559 [Gaeumannomyces tritici R3-111a-1]|uniref:Uncharacterized protein n=1 Tax=Gaeumannomyces tritici (strain R3-111a-1) TaxID=644352 RepID=J3PJ77_GAET3|nr:hypothetical protein GGTG_13559 [Gaeumannomyces tritici R3-111a-1]EJT68895.1 hypothetical protein GGTG_13559 [Gaeumannomyces tritici R3-111a-1]